MTITVQLHENMQYVAQRVLCWARGDEQLISTNSAAGGRLAISIPGAVLVRHGSLYMKPGGPDIVSMGITELIQSINVGNGDALSLQLCQPNAAEQLDMAMTSTDGYEYTCTVPAGVVMDWGDGRRYRSTGAPYSHRYQSGKYQLTLTKDNEIAKSWMLVPSNVSLGPRP